MTDQFVQSVTAKLILLEQRAGRSVSYRILSPILPLSIDSLSVQTAAKQISEFIGLRGLTFVVSFAKQKEGVGGHISLEESSKDVFIEVASEAMQFPEAVMATLCHEVCHKWLQVNNLENPIKSENEVLTDITAVFLGLGKIMLNGCKCVDFRYETLPNRERTITTTRESGYLSRDQLAFTYGLVCAMRNIPASEYMQGLYLEAEQAVRDCGCSHARYFDLRFHKSETIPESIGKFYRDILRLQREFSELDKHMIYVHKACCEGVSAFLERGHKHLQSLHHQLSQLVAENETDPALKFLKGLQTELNIKRMGNALLPLTEETRDCLKHINVLGNHLYRNPKRFPLPSPSMFNIVPCHCDGTKLRLPEKSGDIIVTCPECNYRFGYNTEPVTFPEPQARQKKPFANKCHSFIKDTKAAISSLLSKKR